MVKCDIILPVCNGYDWVVAGIEGVLKNTDFETARLIVIDDKSSDERVLPALVKFAKANPKKMILLKNEKSLGLVKTINKGMKYAKGDVLILDPGVEVGKGWLKKIQKCANYDKEIATVTPLSNEVVGLPEGESFERMAELAEKCALLRYPTISVAGEFCMYIKREVIKKVGYFDEKAFEKKFGEMVEFSLRCMKYGYRNVICDDVYVCKNQRAFEDMRESGGEVVVGEWVASKEVEMVKENLELALAAKEKRPNILILVHDEKSGVGGTTLHMMDVIKNLRSEFNFHVLAPEGGIYKIHSFFEKADMVTAVYERQKPVMGVGLYSDEYEKMLQLIIRDYGISFVHIQHMIGHYFNIREVCKAWKIKYAMSLHDYYLIDAEVGRVDEKIGVSESDLVDIPSWREACKRLLSGASKVIVPSDFVKKQFEKMYGIGKIEVIEHGVDIKKQKKEYVLDNDWNIGFLGAVGTHKGSKVMKELAGIAPENLKVHLFGVTDINIEKSGNYVEHGKYEREQLPKLAKENQIDLFCILSLCPETYSYTVTEAVACGVPVLVTNVGAMQDRVRKNNLGWVIDVKKRGGEVLEEIKKILSDKEKYEQVLSSIEEYKVKTVSEMAEEYGRFYREYTKKTKFDYEKIKQNRLKYEAVWGLIGGDEWAEEKNRLEQELLLSRNHIRNIIAERDYHIVREKILIEDLKRKDWAKRVSGKLKKVSKIVKNRGK